MIFEYPNRRHKRRHGPAGYKVYHPFKDWLRDEFTFRCVFCLSREQWYPVGDAAFSVDHFIPQSSGTRVLDYDNLVYACLRCNSFKRDLPDVLNPCIHPYGSHIRVNSDGTVTPLTKRGEILIDNFRLDQPKTEQLRREMLEYFVWLQGNPSNAEIAPLVKRKFSFPDDLPDLREKRPPSNSRRKGINRCYYVLRERGRLPDAY